MTGASSLSTSARLAEPDPTMLAAASRTAFTRLCRRSCSANSAPSSRTGRQYSDRSWPGAPLGGGSAWARTISSKTPDTSASAGGRAPRVRAPGPARGRRGRARRSRRPDAAAFVAAADQLEHHVRAEDVGCAPLGPSLRSSRPGRVTRCPPSLPAADVLGDQRQIRRDDPQPTPRGERHHPAGERRRYSWVGKGRPTTAPRPSCAAIPPLPRHAAAATPTPPRPCSPRPGPTSTGSGSAWK